MSSYITKTENGNVSIDTARRSVFLAIWQLMHGSAEHHIVETFTNAVTDCLAQPESEERTTRLVNIIIVVMRLRDFRNGGHGRRLESRIAFITVCSLINDTNVTRAMLSLMAKHYGRWQDLNDIRDALVSHTNHEFVESTTQTIAELFIGQIRSEIAGAELTMCAKWFPTENKDIETAVAYARLMFPHITENTTFNDRLVTERTSLKNRWSRLLKTLRLTLKPLRDKIPMIERALCGDMADAIDPGKIPGVALQRSKRALENLASLKSKNGDVQRSDNPRRIQCAQNMADHAKAVQEAFIKHRAEMDELRQKLEECSDEEEKQAIADQLEEAEAEFQETAPKVHGGDTVFIHDLVKQCYREGSKNDLIEAQFMAMQGALPSLTKLKILFVLDDSGSMTNGSYGVTPLEVGTGLIALCASTAPKPMRHKYISFSQTPRVMDVSYENGGDPGLWDYCKFVRKHSEVANTNVQATIDLIASMCSTTGEDLDMIIFLSDLQFDQMAHAPRGCLAGDYLKRKFEQIRKKAPLCAFWNLNAASTDSPAEPSDHGIVMISGYSHTMLESLADTVLNASQANMDEVRAQKALALAAFEEAEHLARAKAQEEMNLNTYQVMLDFCEGKFSYPLRSELSKIDSGLMAMYSFTEPEETEAKAGGGRSAAAGGRSAAAGGQSAAAGGRSAAGGGRSAAGGGRPAAGRRYGKF
jgi:hypothetical protein